MVGNFMAGENTAEFPKTAVSATDNAVITFTRHAWPNKSLSSYFAR